MKSLKLLLGFIPLLMCTLVFSKPESKKEDVVIQIDDLKQAVNITSKKFSNVQLHVSGEKLLLGVIKESGDVPLLLEISEDGTIKVTIRKSGGNQDVIVIDENGDGLPDKRMVFDKNGDFVRVELLEVIVKSDRAKRKSAGSED